MKYLMLYIILTLVINSCAGYRCGVESRISKKTITGSNATIKREKWNDILKVPGLTIELSLKNQIQTSDSIWFGIEIPVVPLSFESKEEYFYYKDEAYLITITITAFEEGFVFNYKGIVLNINGKAFVPLQVTYRQPPMIYSETNELSLLLEPDKTIAFDIFFDTSTPTPDKKIILDLSKAITHEKFPKIPTIYFDKRKWCIGYN